MDAIPAGLLPLALAILLLAGFVKGTTGFGVTLITVPLLSLILPPRQAIPLMSLPVLIINFTTVLMTIGEWREIRRVMLLIPGGLLFVPVGVWLLLWVNPDVMRALIGLTILFMVGMRFWGWSAFEMPKRGQRLFALGTGAAAGLMGGAIMLPLAPMAFYLNATRTPREAFVLLVNLLPTLILVAQAILFVRIDEEAARLWGHGLVMIVPALVGLFAGTRLRRRISQDFFERLVLLVLAGVSVSLLGRFLATFWG